MTLQIAAAAGHVAHLRVAPEVADEDDFVDRGHGVLRAAVEGCAAHYRRRVCRRHRIRRRPAPGCPRRGEAAAGPGGYDRRAVSAVSRAPDASAADCRWRSCSEVFGYAGLPRRPAGHRRTCRRRRRRPGADAHRRRQEPVLPGAGDRAPPRRAGRGGGRQPADRADARPGRRAATKLGVHAAFLNSTLDGDEARRIERELLAGRLVLLYAAPERS